MGFMLYAVLWATWSYQGTFCQETQNRVFLCCAAISSALPGKVHFPGNATYQTSVQSYFAAQERELRPSCIVKPTSTSEVSRAVKILFAFNTPHTETCKFAIRGGGHTPFAESANIAVGITIDLQSINQVQLSPGRDIARIGGGAHWSDVYAALQSSKLAVAGGRLNTVGVGGLTLGGGVSFFAPRMGFVCDNVVNYEVVLANGDIINANKDRHQDLRNALRGGSNNFGIVTRFDLQTFVQGDLWGGTTFYDISAKSQLMKAFIDLAKDPNYDENAAIYQFFGYSSGQVIAATNMVYTKATANPPVFQPFTSIQPQLFSDVKYASLLEMTSKDQSGSFGHRNLFLTTSFEVDLAFYSEVYDQWSNFTEKIKSTAGLQNTLINLPIVPKFITQSNRRGGNSLGLADTKGPFIICLISLTWDSATDDTSLVGDANKLILDIEMKAKARNVFKKFKYLNYANVNQPVVEGYGAGNVVRLRAVSKLYDPRGIFQQAVPGGFKMFR